MELWFIITTALSLFVAVFLNFLIATTIRNRKLPPGPPAIPIFGVLQWLGKSIFDVEPMLRLLRPKYGPIITLHVGTRTQIFILDRSLAHKALVQQGSFFSNRPRAPDHVRILNSNHHNINSAEYGPLWRALRRNLTSEVLHSSRIKSFAQGRRWALHILLENFRRHADSSQPVCVVEIFEYALFCLLIFMCFGRKLDEGSVTEIGRIQQRLLLSVNRFNVLALLPKVGKLIYRKRWNELLHVRKEQERLLVPLIRACKDRKQGTEDEKGSGSGSVFSYADSLLDLEIPDDGGRKLTEGEMVSLCSEFLNAGTDTTATSLQWIMANLVKNQAVQETLAEELGGVMGDEVGEEDLSRLAYLKAVIMKGLRRHPPGHFVLPHRVSEEVTLEGYVIPTSATLNFAVAEMGWDEKVWEEAMAFKPERFMEGGGGEKVDITGTREIKMMPFGVGRRICPGLNLALLHLEYFMGNLVREFEWRSADGEEVDLTEKQEFTVVMKNPLKARIARRRRKSQS